MGYYNTTGETGSQLKQYKRKAATQSDLILRFFQQRSKACFSPSYIQQNCMPGTPLTSVRRAITNLTKQGKLVKLNRKVEGPYGRPEYVWKYNIL